MVRRLKVLIVDMSLTVQRLLADIINADNNMVVIGSASDPYMAREKIKLLQPDLITLDVNLPKMDGVTFLRNLMRLHPLPVVMVIGDDAESFARLKFCRQIGISGAFIKSPLLVDSPRESDAHLFLSEIRKAADLKEEVETPIKGFMPQHSADVILQYQEPRVFSASETLIAIGASTGGIEAIQKVLVELPRDMPAIVITQHIPGNFSGAFAERINKLTNINVLEAIDGERILPGHVYIAPGDQHLMVKCRQSQYYCALNNGPAVNRHKPSVDVLFRSVAQTAGPKGIGILLTGMGNDGAVGLLEMKQAKAPTLVQDEATSVVWGMPGSAVKLGAADEVIPLDKMAGKLLGELKTQEITNKVKEFARLRRFK